MRLLEKYSSLPQAWTHLTGKDLAEEISLPQWKKGLRSAWVGLADAGQLFAILKAVPFTSNSQDHRVLLKSAFVHGLKNDRAIELYGRSMDLMLLLTRRCGVVSASFEGQYTSEPLRAAAFEEEVGSLLQVARHEVRPLFALLDSHGTQKDGRVSVHGLIDLLTEMQALYLPFSDALLDEEVRASTRRRSKDGSPGRSHPHGTGSTTIPDDGTPADFSADSGADDTRPGTSPAIGPTRRKTSFTLNFNSFIEGQHPALQEETRPQSSPHEGASGMHRRPFFRASRSHSLAINLNMMVNDKLEKTQTPGDSRRAASQEMSSSPRCLNSSSPRRLNSGKSTSKELLDASDSCRLSVSSTSPVARDKRKAIFDANDPFGFSVSNSLPVAQDEERAPSKELPHANDASASGMSATNTSPKRNSLQTAADLRSAASAKKSAPHEALASVPQGWSRPATSSMQVAEAPLMSAPPGWSVAKAAAPQAEASDPACDSQLSNVMGPPASNRCLVGHGTVTASSSHTAANEKAGVLEHISTHRRLIDDRSLEKGNLPGAQVQKRTSAELVTRATIRKGVAGTLDSLLGGSTPHCTADGTPKDLGLSGSQLGSHAMVKTPRPAAKSAASSSGSHAFHLPQLGGLSSSTAAAIIAGHGRT
jgi:hypothetical protein